MSIQQKLFDVTGRVAIVTGASSGCGVEFAKALAEGGAKVVIAARRLNRLEELADTIKKTGGEAIPIACDVTKPADVANVVETAVRQFGRVDVMVNNAGALMGAGYMPERATPEDAEANLRTNLLGAWYGCQSAGLQMMKQRSGGSIINIGSVGGLGGFADQTPFYGAAKAALHNLTETLAASWGNRRIRVNALALGFFPSEMSQYFLSTPDGARYATEQTALDRIGRPEELAGPILFLASDASSYLTGTIIPIDGGMRACSGPRMPAKFYDMLAELPNDIGKRIGL